MEQSMREVSQKKHLLTILVSRMGINMDDFHTCVVEFHQNQEAINKMTEVQ
jgi:hypothetical protein